MKKFVKVVAACAAMYGAYKLYKYIDEKEKEKAEKIKKHRETVLEEIDGEFSQAENWNKSIKDITLNNEHLKPSDRAYAYRILKEKYDGIVNAKTIGAIDEARKGLEEFYEVLMSVTDPDTLESYFKLDLEEKNYEEKLRQEKEAREVEIQKYKQIGDVIERIGTKVVCELVQ